MFRGKTLQVHIKVYYVPKLKTCIARYVGAKNGKIASGDYPNVLHKATLRSELEGLELVDE